LKLVVEEKEKCDIVFFHLLLVSTRKR